MNFDGDEYGDEDNNNNNNNMNCSSNYVDMVNCIDNGNCNDIVTVDSDSNSSSNSRCRNELINMNNIQNIEEKDMIRSISTLIIALIVMRSLPLNLLLLLNQNQLNQ